MFDIRSAQPDSPVDTSMLPPLYSHASDAAMDSWMRLAMNGSKALAPALPALLKAATPKALPSLFEVRTRATSSATPKASESVVYDCELEPFEYQPGVDKARSASIFDDQDLVDAIMGAGGLDFESLITPRANRSASTPMNTAIAATTSFTAALSAAQPKMTISIPPTSSMKMPLTRKPGTFLNKDGRWIKGKPCRMDACDKRAQSNGLCKGHGGGARCNFNGCAKSSQGGGFCRAHGGGKRCLHEGCEKGTQRNGYCYLHGGVRSCTVEGCDKKDRGNGKCFSHGGGRKCQAAHCATTIRRGVFCDAHNSKLLAKKL